MTRFPEPDLPLDEETVAVAREMPLASHVASVSRDRFCSGSQQKPGNVFFLNQDIVGKCEICSAFFIFNLRFMEWVEQK